MKITKTQLKQIIKEEITFEEELLDAVEELTDQMKGLDVSIDYLASVFTGKAAAAIQGQQAMGRLARPPAEESPQRARQEAKELELKKIVQEELESVLREMQGKPHNENHKTTT